MGERGAGTWRWRVGMLALLTLACGAPTSGPARAAPAPAPAAPSPPPPPAPPPQPASCPGSEVPPPEPALAGTLPCTEAVYEGDGSLRLRTVRRFDAAGRLLLHESQGPGATSVLVERRNHDAAGRLTLQETPEQRTQWTRDVCGRPELLEEHGPGARLQTTRSTYDALGRLTDVARSLEQPGAGARSELHHLDYAPEGHLLRREVRVSEGALATLEVSTYDASGHVVERVRTLSGPEGPPRTETVRSEYDAQGRLLLTRESRGDEAEVTTRHTYDAQGRLLQVVHGAPGSAGWRERNAYDGEGRPTERVHEEVDPEGLLSGVARWSCTYSTGGGREERFQESGPRTDWTRRYDARGLLVEWTEEDRHAGSLLHGSAGYGPAGELTRKEEERDSGAHHWTYLEEHTYDGAGRRTRTDAQSLSTSGGGASYAYTQHRWEYDGEGRAVLHEEWDLAGPEPVLLLRTGLRYECGPAVH